jgi:hypothetical protein
VLCARQNEKDPSLLSLKDSGKIRLDVQGIVSSSSALPGTVTTFTDAKTPAACRRPSSRIAVTATATATSTESGPAQKAWPFCSRIYTDAADANHDRYPSSPVKRYPFGRRTVGQPVALYATVSKVL